MKKLVVLLLALCLSITSLAVFTSCLSKSKKPDKHGTDAEQEQSGGDEVEKTEQGIDYDVENWNETEDAFG